MYDVRLDQYKPIPKVQPIQPPKMYTADDIDALISAALKSKESAQPKAVEYSKILSQEEAKDLLDHMSSDESDMFMPHACSRYDPNETGSTIAAPYKAFREQLDQHPGVRVGDVVESLMTLPRLL